MSQMLFSKATNKKSTYLIIVVLLLATTFTVYYYSEDYLFYKLNQKSLERKFAVIKPSIEKTAEITKPVSTKLVIPKIHFEQFVTYADGDLVSQTEALKSGPVHYGGTALPGQKGNVLIGGHYIWYTFKNLYKLKVNDLFELRLPSQVLKYKVIQTKVIREDKLAQAMKYGGKKDRFLTLYTCVYPSKVTHKRFLVISKQIYPPNKLKISNRSTRNFINSQR